MISNRKLVLYACIAKGSTIVAEFVNEPGIVEAAQGCIEKTPPHHSMFSHTVKKKTYTFLIEDPFAYFAIFDEDLDRGEGLWLLNRLSQAFQEKIRRGSIQDSDNLAARCFQGKMDSFFSETLMLDPVPVDPPATERNVSWVLSTDSTKGMKAAERELPATNEGLKKKKKVSGEMSNGNDKARANTDMVDSNGYRDLPVQMQKNAPILFPGNDRQRAKQVWKKHVWVVMVLDLFVCSILFGIWLWVCRGLQCIDR